MEMVSGEKKKALDLVEFHPSRCLFLREILSLWHHLYCHSLKTIIDLIDMCHDIYLEEDRVLTPPEDSGENEGSRIVKILQV